MNTLRKLRHIRQSIARIEQLKSTQDLDIVVEIGYHQRLGQPLSLKQLLLLNLASSATARRHLSRLVREGVVVRNISRNDHRTVNFTLSEATYDALEACLDKIERIVREPLPITAPTSGEPDEPDR